MVCFIYLLQFYKYVLSIFVGASYLALLSISSQGVLGYQSKPRLPHTDSAPQPSHLL